MVSLLAISTTLTACAGSGGGGGGKTTNVGEKNPFSASGDVVIKEKTTLYTSLLYSDEPDAQGVLILDPNTKTFSFDSKNDYAIAGEFDPETGELKTTSCTSSIEEVCEDAIGEEVNFYDYMKTSVGGDYVRLLGTNGYFPKYYATNPTEAQNLPNGTVDYSGQVAVYAEQYNSNNDDYEEFSDTGTAVTTVNFDNGTLEAEFGNFEGEFAGTEAYLSGTKVDGASFSGGEITIKNPDNSVSQAEDTLVNGHVFGPDGTELGGSAYFSTGRTYIDASWYGIQQ